MTRVFIHSWHADFAKSDIVSEFDNQGCPASEVPGAFEVSGSGCGAAGLQRIRRRPWMRVVLSFRLNRRCRRGAVVLTRKFRSREDPPA